MDGETEREALNAAKVQAHRDLAHARGRDDALGVKAAKADLERIAYRLRKLERPSLCDGMPPQTAAYVAFLAKHFPQALGLRQPTRPGMPWKPNPALLAAAEVEALMLRVAYLRSRVMKWQASPLQIAKAHLSRIVRVWARQTAMEMGALKRIARDLSQAIQQGSFAIGEPDHRLNDFEAAPMVEGSARLGATVPLAAARLRELRRLNARPLREARKGYGSTPPAVERYLAAERQRAAAREAARDDLFGITREALKAKPGHA
ncbi:hypothetical protein AAFN86_20855 [Roseomonas sp. CAU 1739]|uniref:hypothetical protein n=1 Tax=Roseomonas sp. CAU 1739 TaxID=3140364 RepID=UPI00325A537D